MNIKKIEAYSFDGKTYETEEAAIQAAIAKRIGNTPAVARNIADSAADLIPLLQRVLEIRSPSERPIPPQ